MTDEVIDKSYLAQYGDMQIGEIASAGFTAEEMKRNVSTVQLMKTNSDLPTRKAGGKREIVPKDGKDTRSTVDNTAEVFTALNAAGKTFEHVCFNPVDGIFRHYCIKHKTRALITSDLAATFSKKGCFGWEIDQTRMEAHVRAPGTMRIVVKILQKVMDRVMHRFSGQLTHQYAARLSFDLNKGMRIKMTVNNVCLPGGKKTVTLKFEDFYLDSGWLLASLCNFLLETGATISCLVQKPQHTFAVNKATGKLHIQGGTFNHQFRGLAINGVRPERPVYFRPKTEGDDGAGQISRHASTPEQLAKLVADNMADLGFDAKFKIIKDGRLEFVGLHALVKDGVIDTDTPIIPAVKRALGKLGMNAHPGGRNETINAFPLHRRDVRWKDSKKKNKIHIHIYIYKFLLWITIEGEAAGHAREQQTRNACNNT